VSLFQLDISYINASVGKTALLRQVLTDSRFHVLHFDLRIAGFADVTSLYMSLAAQFEHFFETLATELEGYDEMKKHGLTFKHAWMDWEKRLSLPENQMKVSPSDIS
jgi:AAA+ ATPase superfamily predicted ATPase